MLRTYPTTRPILVLLLCFGLLMGCGQNNRSSSDIAVDIPPLSESFFIFDTIVTVKLFDERATDQQLEDIHELLMHIDATMSRTVETSEISKVNREAGQRAVKVSQDTYDLVAKALAYAEASDGHFDPTIGPLVDLWRIGEEGATVPPKELVAKSAALVQYQNVQLSEPDQTIKLLEPGMSIDLGAIAKGYAADEIASYVTEQGILSALIDLGGNILTVGTKPDGSQWTIGIQDPDDSRGNIIGTMKLVDESVVTSGVYERYFIEEGIRYHHILNTATGYPVQNSLNSVTMITPKSTDADAMSTTLFSLGLEEGMRFIEAREDTEAIFVTTDREVILTSGLKGVFQLTNDAYQLGEP